MTYNEALEVINKGGKVKLPEWQGFLFESLTGIQRVVTRNGDIIDNPILDDYISRTDWESTIGTRDFGGALLALKNNKRVSRLAWHGCHISIRNSATLLERETTDTYLKAIAHENSGEVKCLPTIRMKTRDGRILTGWNPNLIEIFAEDWVIIM